MQAATAAVFAKCYRPVSCKPHEEGSRAFTWQQAALHGNLLSIMPSCLVNALPPSLLWLALSLAYRRCIREAYIVSKASLAWYASIAESNRLAQMVEYAKQVLFVL